MDKSEVIQYYIERMWDMTQQELDTDAAVAHKREEPQYLLAAELRARDYVVRIPLLNVDEWNFDGPELTIEHGKAEINFLDKTVSIQAAFKLSFKHIQQITAIIEKYRRVV